MKVKMSVGLVGRVASGRRKANGRDIIIIIVNHIPRSRPGRLIFDKELKQRYSLVDRF
jgi:hypothetical protein